MDRPPTASRQVRRSASTGREPRPVVTMRDVARATGVSQSTVSRVLSDTSTVVPIAAATRNRVVAAARELGYQPNPFARGLRGMPTMLLGVIVRDITDPFFAGAIEAVSVSAAERGYNVVLGHAHGRADEAIALRGVLEARHCDAILLLGDMSDQPRLLDDVRNAHVPVVGLWQGASSDGLAAVSVDNEAGIRAAIEHVRTLGPERIGFVAGRGLGDLREREAAFRRYLAELGRPLRNGWIQYADNNPTQGAGALTAMLALSEPPSAVVCSTDVLALGVLHEAARHGVDVPGGLSVTGFDDISLAAFSMPSLTTVRMPVHEMVDAAISIVIDELPVEPDEAKPRRTIAPSLVARASTAPPGASQHVDHPRVDQHRRLDTT